MLKLLWVWCHIPVFLVHIGLVCFDFVVAFIMLKNAFAVLDKVAADR